MGRCRRGGGQTGGYPPPSQFAMVVARRRQGGFLQLPCSLGFRLAASATGGARLPQFPMVVARRRQGGFLQLPCSPGFRLAFSATGGARLPQFPMVVGRRRQGGFLQLPCSLGFRLASSATGGARLRPPAAFEKSGGKLAGKLFWFLTDYAGGPLIGSGPLGWRPGFGTEKTGASFEGTVKTAAPRGGAAGGLRPPARSRAAPGCGPSVRAARGRRRLAAPGGLRPPGASQTKIPRPGPGDF